MGIVCTNLEEFKKAIADEVARIDFLTKRALYRLGEESVTTARHRAQNESWYDHTGNLRSSIGYVITENSVALNSNEYPNTESFKAITSPDTGNPASEGSEKGKRYANEIAKTLNSDLGLVVVAGMEYAQKVEDIEGKDVLATAENEAMQKFPAYMEMLKQQIEL